MAIDWKEIPQFKGRTPKGIAGWCFLHEPTENYSKNGYEYRCVLYLSEEDAAPMIERLERLFEENVEFFKKSEGKKAKPRIDRPWFEEEDEDDNPTGRVGFKFKIPATITRKSDGKEFDMRPRLVDAQGNPCPGVPVGSGSTLVIGYHAMGYFAQGCGIKLELKVVQIIDLKAYTGGSESLEDYGIAADEDGFCAADADVNGEPSSLSGGDY